MKKKRITVYLDESLYKRIKNMVYWVPGTTITSFINETLDAAMTAIEKEFGKPFDDYENK